MVGLKQPVSVVNSCGTSFQGVLCWPLPLPSPKPWARVYVGEWGGVTNEIPSAWVAGKPVHPVYLINVLWACCLHQPLCVS